MRRIRWCLLGTVLALAVTSAPAEAATGDIFTIAGTGTGGFAGDSGPATSAQLNLPRGAAFTPGGGLLIADRQNGRVRRVWPDGTITTVAGDGTTGFGGDGGPATDAQIDFIHDAVPTPDGGFLISDTRNQRVRYVSPAGTITTAAGSGPFGSFGDGWFSGDSGPATGARLNNPHGIAANPDGSYLIADTDNNRVREVAANGTITTVAGSGPFGYGGGAFAGDGGPATASRLKRPFEVAPTGGGGFLITDTGNQVIRRVWPDGTITTVAGTPGQIGYGGDGGPATQALLFGPSAAVPTPDGGFLIADEGNQRVRYVSSAGTISTVAGSGVNGYGGDGGPATQALLNAPKELDVSSGGDFLVVDESNHAIRFVDADLVPPPDEPPAPGDGPPGGAISSGGANTAEDLEVKILKSRIRVRPGDSARLAYTSTVAAKARLVVRRGGERVTRLREQAGPGRNRFTLHPGLTRDLDPGRFRLVLKAHGTGGQRDRDSASLLVGAIRRR